MSMYGDTMEFGILISYPAKLLNFLIKYTNKRIYICLLLFHLIFLFWDNRIVHRQ